MARELMCDNCIHKAVCNMWLDKLKMSSSMRTPKHVLRYVIVGDDCKYRIENSELNKVDYK
jgi:hypothetical protein